MDNCTTCQNAIFDALWGEYICSIDGYRKYCLEFDIECPHYKKGTPKESKRNADYKANLQDC